MTEPDNLNPYASPQAVEEPGDAPAWDAWSDNGAIVTPPKSALPRRCFVCNAPARREGRLRRTGWISSRGITNISVQWYLCDLHRARQRWLWAARAGLAVLLVLFAQLPSVFAVTGAPVSQLSTLLSFGFVLLLFCLVLAAEHFLRRWSGKWPTIIEASPQQVKLKGAGEPFAESLKQEPQ